MIKVQSQIGGSAPSNLARRRSMLTVSGGTGLRDASGGAAIRSVQQATKTVSILDVTEDMVGEGFLPSGSTG
jgi:hypothetical protein